MIMKGSEFMEMTQNDIFANYPDVVSIDELKNMLHIGRNTAYKLLNENKIKAIRIGKKFIIPKSSVISFITQNS